MDALWRWMKEYVPYNLRVRKGATPNPALDEYTFSWQWRHNCKAAGDLWTALGGLVQKG